MVPFGQQNLTLGQTANFVTGVGYEYITVKNLSAYFANLNFVGQGSTDLFPNTMQDFPVNQSYRGSLIVTASNQQGALQSIGGIISVTGWLKGELQTPQVTSINPSGSSIASLVGTEITAGFQGVDNSTVGIALTIGQTQYLKNFVLTGDKSAAVNTGVMTITNLLNGNTLPYGCTQGPNGFVTIQDSFDPPVQSLPSQEFAFNLPNLAASMNLKVTVINAPNP